MSSDRPASRGRFAPSPTGPLHFGSIVTALGSYLQAKSNHGRWFLRVEDIDIPRTRSGAREDIPQTLNKLGLHWDGEPVIQSQRKKEYNGILTQLADRDLIYPCICPRRETGGRPYAGTCRTRKIRTQKKNSSLQLRVGTGVTGFADGIQGWLQQCLATEVGDYIVRRTDGIHAYHLAVVIDDHLQVITEVVRGADLLDATPRQIYLQQLLQFPTPAYCHLPVATNRQGLKISKQNQAPRINHDNGAEVLYQALHFPGQSPEPALLESDINEIIRWGVSHWNKERIPKQTAIAI